MGDSSVRLVIVAACLGLAGTASAFPNDSGNFTAHAAHHEGGWTAKGGATQSYVDHVGKTESKNLGTNAGKGNWGWADTSPTFGMTPAQANDLLQRYGIADSRRNYFTPYGGSITTPNVWTGKVDKSFRNTYGVNHDINTYTSALGILDVVSPLFGTNMRAIAASASAVAKLVRDNYSNIKHDDTPSYESAFSKWTTNGQLPSGLPDQGFLNSSVATYGVVKSGLPIAAPSQGKAYNRGLCLGAAFKHYSTQSYQHRECCSPMGWLGGITRKQLNHHGKIGNHNGQWIDRFHQARSYVMMAGDYCGNYSCSLSGVSACAESKIK